jgi:hypothetical protein
MMLPGRQAVFTAQQAFHAAYDAAVHAVVQLTTTSRRNAAVLELADRYLERVAEWKRLNLPWLGSPESFPALLGLPSARSFWYSWDYA